MVICYYYKNIGPNTLLNKWVAKLKTVRLLRHFRWLEASETWFHQRQSSLQKHDILFRFPSLKQHIHKRLVG
jgi:hypothetical protein